MYRTILLTLIGVLFFSCSDKKQTSDPDTTGRKLQVDFTVKQAISRTTMDESYNSSFVTGDQIGIFATGGASASNVKHTVTDNNKLTATTSITTDGSGNTCNFYAYHPYSDLNGSGTTISHTVSSNQTTEDDFYASDFVTATALNKVVTQGQALQLAFTHRMAMVELTVVMPEGDAMPLSAKITNCLVEGKWDYAADEFEATGSTSSVSMLSTGDDTGVYLAIVPEQTIAAGTSIFTIETLMSTYTFTAEQDISLKSNFVKKFKVGINTEVESSSEFSAEISIESWQTDDEEIVGQGVEKIANYIVQEDFENGLSISTLSLLRQSQFPTTEGWYFGAEGSTSRFEILDDPNGVLSTKVAAVPCVNNNYWYNYMLAYVTFNVKPGIYRMRAKISGHLQISVF